MRVVEKKDGLARLGITNLYAIRIAGLGIHEIPDGTMLAKLVGGQAKKLAERLWIEAPDVKRHDNSPCVKPVYVASCFEICDQAIRFLLRNSGPLVRPYRQHRSTDAGARALCALPTGTDGRLSALRF
jgi:hypothetical protein